MNYIKIIDIQPSEVVIKIDTQTYLMLLSMIQPQEQNDTAEVTPDFLRRIVPFFMNQFYIWTIFQKDENISCVRETLEKLKNNKISNQKKFELGDLKLIHNSKSKKYIQIRQAWLKFLYSDDIKNCIQNSNKVKEDSKIKYIQSIIILQNELEKQRPYARLLSKYRKGFDEKPQTDTNSQIDDHIQYEEENSTCNQSYFSQS
ncbi:unnamed protein product [Paramecium primaurelia]|uniref:Uncharacterized protein n=1 Tax=Paramecium primaurelia TaxID=5886 RepID=A0A8S1JYP0_PARPR|nr:unnamed protein product [Paramecium primaurelia]